MMMLTCDNAKLWMVASALTPPAKLAGLTAEEAFRTPGACVKSRERENVHGFPVHHGKLVAYEPSENWVLVRTHGGPGELTTEPPTTWEGTIEQYEADWEVD